MASRPERWGGSGNAILLSVPGCVPSLEAVPFLVLD